MFLLKRYCQYDFDTLECVQWFAFEHMPVRLGNIEPACWRCTITVAILHSNIVIYVGSNRCQIQHVGVTCQHNPRKCLSNGCSMLG